MTDAEQVVDELVRLTSEATGASIAPDRGLLDSGLSSVELVSLLERAATRWQLEIPVEVLFERGDLHGLADFILASRAVDPRAAAPPTPAPVPPGQRGSRRHLREQIRRAVSEPHD